jgi:hypothetical protein
MLKKTAVLFMLIAIPGILFSASWKKGDKVEMRGASSGIWFKSTIKDIKGKNYYVLSDGWSQDSVREVDASFLRPLTKSGTVTIRKGGAVWATVSPDGTIRINGSIVGSFDEDGGTVRKSGSIVGTIDAGTGIYKNGSGVGIFEPMGDVYRKGSLIANIDPSDGTIRLSGSIWGGIDGFTRKWRDVRASMAVLVFFAPEFGY